MEKVTPGNAHRIHFSSHSGGTLLLLLIVNILFDKLVVARLAGIVDSLHDDQKTSNPLYRACLQTELKLVQHCEHPNLLRVKERVEVLCLHIFSLHCDRMYKI